MKLNDRLTRDSQLTDFLGPRTTPKVSTRMTSIPYRYIDRCPMSTVFFGDNEDILDNLNYEISVYMSSVRLHQKVQLRDIN